MNDIKAGNGRNPDGATSRILLGRTLPSRKKEQVGFSCDAAHPVDTGGKLITCGDDTPLITIGATGRGKTCGPVVCNARTWPGQLILIDVKGEAYNLSVREREAMGQKVHVLDLRDGMNNTDSLNPLHIAELLGDDLGAISRSVAAEMIDRPGGGEREAFWNDCAETMLTAGIAYQLYHERHDCRISKMFDLYSTPDDLTETLSDLATTKDLNRSTRAGWAGFCALPENTTRPCVLGSTISHLRLYDSDLIRRLTDTTTIDLDALVAGEPMSIYIVVPPHRIKAYAPVLRLWLTMLMGLFTTRRAPPRIPTLLIIDEAAQLGRIDAFESATTLMRGYGLKIWTFWQSISQLEIYGAAAKTLIDNAGVVQVLGVNNQRSAQEIVDIVGGITAEELVEMSGARPPRQLLAVSGRKPRVCRQLRYFDDPMFQG